MALNIGRLASTQTLRGFALSRVGLAEDFRELCGIGQLVGQGGEHATARFHRTVLVRVADENHADLSSLGDV